MGHLFVERKGFTLSELLIVMTIMLLIITGALTVYLISYTTWKEASARASLQREAGLVMEKLVRGVKGGSEAKKNGIREAKSFIISSSGDSVKFKSGLDNQERKFYLSEDSDVIYDPSASMADDEIIVGKDVESLSFKKLSNRRIEIAGTWERQIRGKIITINLETEVIIRN